jgi:hypothetical protein
MSKYQIADASARPRPPERQLLASVLGRALMDLSSMDDNERQSALDWIKDLSNDAPFSVQWVLRHLDMSPALPILVKMAHQEYGETIQHYGKEFTRERRHWRERVFKLS